MAIFLAIRNGLKRNHVLVAKLLIELLTTTREIWIQLILDRVWLNWFAYFIPSLNQLRNHLFHSLHWQKLHRWCLRKWQKEMTLSLYISTPLEEGSGGGSSTTPLLVPGEHEKSKGFYSSSPHNSVFIERDLLKATHHSNQIFGEVLKVRVFLQLFWWCEP